MLNLLVVDGDEAGLMTMKLGLEKVEAAYQLTTARDGEQALGVLRDGALSKARRLVILNFDRASTSVGLLRELRSDPKLSFTPVIVLTTSDEVADRAAAHGLNCAGYFLKPPDFPEFVDLLKSITHYWSAAYFAA